MRKALGIFVVVLGFISSGLFFTAGTQLAESGQDLTTLRSRGGESVNEVYYQNIGRYGIAYSRFSYAMGVAFLMMSLGFGSILITKEEK